MSSEKTEERKEDRERSRATSFHGVNLSIHAAKNIAFRTSRLRYHAMNNVSVHILFRVSIAIDVFEPGTDLSSEYILHRSTERQLSLHLQDIYSSTIGRHRSNVIDPRNKKERKSLSFLIF